MQQVSVCDARYREGEGQLGQGQLSGAAAEAVAYTRYSRYYQYAAGTA